MFYMCKNKGTHEHRGNSEADQHLCFRFMDSSIPLLFMPPTLKKLEGHIAFGLSVCVCVCVCVYVC